MSSDLVTKIYVIFVGLPFGLYVLYLSIGYIGEVLNFAVGIKSRLGMLCFLLIVVVLAMLSVR